MCHACGLTITVLSAPGAAAASGSQEGLDFVSHAVAERTSHGVTHFSISGVSLTLLTRQMQQHGSSSRSSAGAGDGVSMPSFSFGSSSSKVRRRKRRHVGQWVPGVGPSTAGHTAVTGLPGGGREVPAGQPGLASGTQGDVEVWDQEHALLRQWFGDITLNISKGDVTLPADWVLNRLQEESQQQQQRKKDGWFWRRQAGQQQEQQRKQGQQQPDQQAQAGSKAQQRAPAISLIISLPGSAVGNVSERLVSHHGLAVTVHAAQKLVYVAYCLESKIVHGACHLFILWQNKFVDMICGYCACHYSMSPYPRAWQYLSCMLMQTPKLAQKSVKHGSTVKPTSFPIWLSTEVW